MNLNTIKTRAITTDNFLQLWLKWSLTPILFSGVLITIFQFWFLYPESTVLERLTLGPPAFHYVILELFVTTGVCQIVLLLTKQFVLLKRLFLTVSMITISILFIIFFLQFASLYLGNEYISVSTLTTTSQIALVASPFLFLALVTTVFLPTSIILLSWIRFYAYADRFSSLSRFKIILSHVLVTLFIMQSYHLRSMRDLKWEYPAQRTPPTMAFIKTVQSYLEEGALPSQWAMDPNDFIDEDVRTMKRYGISIDTQALYPLIKNHIYGWNEIPELKYLLPMPPPGSNHSNREKLNLIVIFAESLSARMLETYGGKLTDLTPKISRFSQKSLVIRGYVNHAFPTIPALTGTLCSVFPLFSHTDWNRAKAKLGLPPLYCLPQLLNEQGYHTYYLGYSHPRETFFRDQMIDFGFKKTLFYDELSKRYLNESPEHGALGNSDFQMFTSLKGVLEDDSIKNLPFFIAFSTIGTHVGMDVTSRGKKYTQGENPTLNTFHNFDFEFGRFMDWFENSPFVNNTILILTADHAHPPSTDFAQLVSRISTREYQKLPFDEIPLIIKDPRSHGNLSIETQSVSLDFAPSVAHLLGIPNRSNHFLGHSIFEMDYQKQPRLGIVDGGTLLLYSDRIVQTNDIDPIKCFKQKSSLDNCQIARGIYYIFHLMNKKRIWAHDDPDR
jgi:lipoteichoic acid synthase